MDNSVLTKENIQNIISGRESDPFAFLGFHKLDNQKKSAVIRVFNPFAQKISVITNGLTIETPMEKIHEDGLYETFINEEECKYKLLITDNTGKEKLTEDTYSFPPVIGEFDNYLLREGNHFELYHKMGAHPMNFNGVDGVAFAVWAPDAYRVSVVGDFNNWDGRVNVMRRHPVSGIWDIFIPHLTEGTIYKYELISKDGRLLPLKSDPYGFYQELRPKTASVVWNQDSYKWEVNEHWDKVKKAVNSIDAPISIYEVHLGSWKRKDGNQ
ncbi:MAG: 1,4-alpha-glucan branching enzyme, partial [Alphaproteobacteria bacterium]|nr:1,4-alpha-glucan branching enzyme [Alphaproteobacteria bacterium]